MAYESPAAYGTFPASTGLRQYTAVQINSNGRLIKPTTEGNAIGVLVSSGTTGSTGRAGSTDSGSVQTVQFTGITKMLAGIATIGIGDTIKAATDGRASTASSTSYRMGVALGASTGSTSAQVFSVLLLPSVGAWA